MSLGLLVHQMSTLFSWSIYGLLPVQCGVQDARSLKLKDHMGVGQKISLSPCHSPVRDCTVCTLAVVTGMPTASFPLNSEETRVGTGANLWICICCYLALLYYNRMSYNLDVRVMQRSGTITIDVLVQAAHIPFSICVVHSSNSKEKGLGTTAIELLLLQIIGSYFPCHSLSRFSQQKSELDGPSIATNDYGLSSSSGSLTSELPELDVCRVIPHEIMPYLDSIYHLGISWDPGGFALLFMKLTQRLLMILDPGGFPLLLILKSTRQAVAFACYILLYIMS
ncbi:hypothetical protein D1007_19107 [Hordeum vulgare]|nr:hypothetical protein D1007_19107 [Hordeum vulgare]